MEQLCCRCEKLLRTPGQRWCLTCRAAYMREWRRARGGHKALSAEQKKRSNARAYANVYQKRGELSPPETCQGCGEKPQKFEKHHADYEAPLVVVWLCRPCHVKLTAGVEPGVEKP